MDPHHEELLRRLALNDEVTVESVLQVRLTDVDPSLDAKTGALVRLASLIALQSSTSSYDWCVAEALAAGASDAEIVGVLTAVAPVVGVARLNRAAYDVGAALGHDIGLPEPRTNQPPNAQPG